MKLTATRLSWILATIVFSSASQVVVDPPDVELNPATGLIQAVDATWSSNNYNVRFTEGTPDGDTSTSMPLTTNSANDLDPRVACTEKGDVLVVWWRDLTTDALVFRKRAFGSSWTAEKLLGLPSESASRPRVVDMGTKFWVAYQIQKSSQSRSIGAQVIEDDSEPTRSIVATTSYTGNLDIEITYQSGHLWITWIDSASRVGYSEYNQTTLLWGAVAVESYAADSIASARSRIRSRILGL